MKRLNSDILEVARQAEKAGMRAIVLKCLDFPSGGYAYLASQIVKNIKIFGMIVLDKSIGGLNLTAVNNAIPLGRGIPGEYTRVISMPVFSAPGSMKIKAGEQEIVEVVKNGKVVPEVWEICGLVAEHKLALATGHLNYENIVPVVEAAKQQGVERIVITHPQRAGVSLTVDEQLSLADMGAYMEVCYCAATKYHHDKYPDCGFTGERLVEEINKVGVARCMFATDFGADPGTNFPPVEGLKMFIEDMLKYGMTEEEIETMKANAAYILGLP
jgi:hypothetical protein